MKLHNGARLNFLQPETTQQQNQNSARYKVRQQPN
jgi:hypothetical protein